MGTEPAEGGPLRGLSPQEVADRIQRGLINAMPPRSGRTTGQIFAANIFTRINAILFILFVIVMTTGHVLQGLFGLLIIANSSIGIIQEMRAKRTLDSLAVVGEAHPTVIRGDERFTVDRDAVVIDDLIFVKPGDQIVVDGSVVEADYLEVDESMLTGEADPIAKAPGDKVLSGGYVVAGAGIYRAEKIGGDAYAAQITAQASKFTLVKSELRQGINKILKVISFLLVPTAALSIWVNFQQDGLTWQESVLRMTASLVPMVPEGLVLLTSMAFALGVIRLGRRKCLVQELPAIEGLARVSVVCVDKTGTLTEHWMTLGDVLPLADLDESEVREVLGQLVAADPAPNASMQAIGAAVPTPEQRWATHSRAPFNATHKWSGATFQEHGSWVLGAAEVLSSGATEARAEDISASGRRVLLLGRSDLDVATPNAPGVVTPVALVVLDQSLRPDAAETLEYFTRQGVEIKVISGDNAASVGAVTRALGLEAPGVIDARSLPDDETGFTEAVGANSVFGRVTPEQKRRFVKALQAKGHAVAMTGDGVNDVLALKDADLGVAMGSGSSATRSVAQLVLLDDKFATLPYVVSEGRRVIGNIERVAKLFLTKTMYAVFMALVIGILHLPYPLLPIHITVVGWFTIGIPAFLLSLAPNNARARTGFVRRVLAVGIPSGIIVGASSILTYVLTRGFGDVSDEIQTQASTAALAALIIAASWVLSVVSRPWVTWRVLLVIFGYAFYTVMLAWPVSQRLLELDSTNQEFMMIGITAGLIGAVLIEIVWWVTAAIRRERPRVWSQPRPRKAALT